MRCIKCGANNSPGNNFCAQCGDALVGLCAKCGAENSPKSNFCGKCGAAFAAGIADAPASQTAPAESHETGDGERRHLTVLFCDLVNSTEITARLDPEEWRDIAADYQRSAAEAVTRFGGHVAKYLGDGLVVFFGYPQAHEDDAARAVRGGLAIVDSISRLNDRLAVKPSAVKLAVRVGIHSGSVVVGQGGGKEADVFGDAPNIASRVQGVAAPDTVVITAPVHQLVSGLFVVEDRGAHQLKGIAEPIMLYRVVEVSGTRGRIGAAALHGLTPFVGRDDELRMLWSRWELAREGEGQVVLIGGEAGIGKSRVIQQFRERLAGTPHTWIEGASEPYFQNTPFYPLADMLSQAFGLRAEHTEEERVDRLDRALQRAGQSAVEAVPLVAQLLNLPVGNRYPASTLSPEQGRRRLLATLANWLFGAATLQPTVLVLEDLQWTDASTLEFLQILVEQGATTPLMLLCTSRPEFRAPWAMRAHHAQITLNRLHNRLVREMLAGVAASHALTSEVIDAVVSRTSGVPLFVEELTRAVLESGERDTSREIPETLHDSLMARLDRLGHAKEAAQVASVIGREFSYELLSAVSPMPEDELQSALTKLADAELIYARGIPPEASYTFKHALIQDAAYEALLKSRRKELHRRVAVAISAGSSAATNEQGAVLARHWAEAGEIELAVNAWHDVANSSAARGALQEAENSYQHALENLASMPESSSRDQLELNILGNLAGVLNNTRGYGAPETAKVTERARSLAEKSGNLQNLVQRMLWSWMVTIGVPDYPHAKDLADEIWEIAQREGTPASLLLAFIVQQVTRYWTGDLAGSDDYFRRAISYFDMRAISLLKENPSYYSYAGFNLWTMGLPDTASELTNQAMSIDFGASDVLTQLRLSGTAAMLAVQIPMQAAVMHIRLRETEAADRVAKQALALSEEYGIPALGAVCRGVQGRVMVELGKTAEGVALLRDAVKILDETVTRLGITEQITSLAHALGQDGKIEEGLIVVEDALRRHPTELVNRPEAFRVRGELRLKSAQPDLAEADFREAIAISQRIGGRMLELRATTSLARLLAKQGKRDEARGMLAEIYNWFTEGFETADLKDAQALMEELNA